MRRCGRVGRVLSWHKEEDAMSIPKTPLEPNDFPVSADGKKIKKQDGTPIAIPMTGRGCQRCRAP
jgi:hypothetical protein